MWDTEGHVVTNYHVIQQAQKATVTGLGSGDVASMASYDATLVGRRARSRVFKVTSRCGELRRGGRGGEWGLREASRGSIARPRLGRTDL